ncbi:LOW QUALITY PROTEIN: probable LRR receptor-like serine/threonine-protein kinase At2g16250 [Phalaenopsis equestris]|uniref:LOW QUALITY PROTEIN: probable LRR receptor-like serine/threonine-protein kinase At2g16250 n=1 Tax=Phalaenopsis equestris TaxID=78828 RepID=UPI0009E2DA4E|nr:LOW QUALITY PROTEIN: probable LRR receptor-like serine/threonine-protein kinase At2g16250 [Phalaenopsis equestris]
MPTRILPRLLILALTSLLITVSAGQNLSSAVDLAALFRLRASLGLRARDWPRRADPCSSWAGVACGGGGRVVSVNLYGLRRTRLARRNPRFAVEGIQNLTRLVSFNATGFALPGPIPKWFGSLLPTSIAVIDLRRASVTGDIPYILAGNLTVLSLAENSITGSIPQTISQLRNLSVLDLSQNALTGGIPSEMGSLRQLKTLMLAENNLTGFLPQQLGNLSSLVILDLGFNSLFGTLPDGLNKLGSLRNLNLGSNLFRGSIGVSLFTSMTRLESITLSRNNFSGELPDSLWSLSKLRYLDVSYNNFTGSLPALPATNSSASNSRGSFNLSHNLLYGSISSGFAVLLSTFNYVDLSDNYLQGSVPPSSTGSNLSVKSNCFQNTSSQRSRVDCQEFYKERGLTYDVPGNPVSPPSSSKSKNTWKYIVAAVVGGTALLVFAVICLLLCFWWCRSHSSDQREVSPNAAPAAPEGGKEPLPAVAINLPAVGEVFTFVQLAHATSDFGEGNLIKHGKSGDIYQGILENGRRVVVKRINMNSVKREACQVELDLFARLSHERLVPFVGHCLENENEIFLVYRLMPHRDLATAFYRKAAQEDEGLQSLDWITRLKIATGAAEGLCYLHHDCVPPLVHRDIQARSILLDDKFEVRLGSLSNACAQEVDGHQNVISRLLRKSQTPEESSSGPPPASWSYDVYCFGKVLLELVTGRLGISGSNDPATKEWLEQTLRFVNIGEKELVAKIVDPSLIVDEDLIEEVWAMAIVAKSCLNPKPSKRPLMRYILKALENPLKVVREDSNSESARLKAASSRSLWNAAFFGSWRESSSDMPSVSAVGPPAREDRSFRRSGTMRSQGSGGEHSFSGRRCSKEICPEPPDVED